MELLKCKWEKARPNTLDSLHLTPRQCTANIFHEKNARLGVSEQTDLKGFYGGAAQ